MSSKTRIYGNAVPYSVIEADVKEWSRQAGWPIGLFNRRDRAIAATVLDTEETRRMVWHEIIDETKAEASQPAPRSKAAAQLCDWCDSAASHLMRDPEHTAHACERHAEQWRDTYERVEAIGARQAREEGR